MPAAQLACGRTRWTSLVFVTRRPKSDLRQGDYHHSVLVALALPTARWTSMYALSQALREDSVSIFQVSVQNSARLKEEAKKVRMLSNLVG